MTKRLPPLFEPLHRVMQRNKSAVKLFQPWQCICSQPISLASQALLLSHAAKVASPSHDRNNLNLTLTRLKRPQPYFHVNRKQTLQISTIHTRRQLMKMCTTSTNAKKNWNTESEITGCLWTRWCGETSSLVQKNDSKKVTFIFEKKSSCVFC